MPLFESVNNISLRVSEAGPQLSDCHDSKKSPNANVPVETMSSPKPDRELPSKADTTKSEHAEPVVEKATISEPSSVAPAINTDSIEVMDVTEDVAAAISIPDEVKSLSPSSNSIKDPSDQIDAIIVGAERRSPVVNGSAETEIDEKSPQPQKNGEATTTAVVKEPVVVPAPAVEKLLNGESSAPVFEAIKKESVEAKDAPTEKASAREQPEDSRPEKRDAAGAADTVSSGSRKRKASDTLDSELQPPSKNLRTDLESNIAEYDKLIHGLINESTTSNDPDNIQSDIDQLQQEIDTLTEAARIKELEWNNILYLKKMKEDMLLRIMRKKAVMEIMSSSDLDYSNADGALSNDSDAQLTLSNNNNNNNLANSKTTIELAKERCNMNSSDLAKERSSINRMHRNIQGKSTNSGGQSEDGGASALSAANTLLTNYMATLSNVSPATILQQEFLQQRLRQDGHGQSHGKQQQPQFGRQGPIKDVKSLIDDFRQQHPEAVPRRGRRMKNVSQHSNSNHSFDRHNDDDSLLGRNALDLASRSSSNDSAMLNNAQASKNFGLNILTDHNSSPMTSTPLVKQSSSNVGYPEVTLHPIKSSGQPAKAKNDTADMSANQSQSSSLLHGILTKTARQQKSSAVSNSVSAASALLANVTAGYNNSFSPTLARLLTAPERNLTIAPTTAQNTFLNAQIGSAKNPLLRSQQQSQPEISFVPISQILAQQQQLQNNSLLQQQLQRQRENARYNAKSNSFVNMEDETDDNDRLVIDEGMFAADESHDNELPECQGCKKREAQFVCADCQRQWYCSRECQVLAWDEHSEVCSR